MSYYVEPRIVYKIIDSETCETKTECALEYVANELCELMNKHLEKKEDKIEAPKVSSL